MRSELRGGGAHSFLREHALLQYENPRSLGDVFDAEWMQIQEVRAGQWGEREVGGRRGGRDARGASN